MLLGRSTPAGRTIEPLWGAETTDLLHPYEDPARTDNLWQNNQGKAPSGSDIGLEILYTLYKPL